MNSVAAATAPARIARLAATYKHAYVLVPHELLRDAKVLEAACR